MILIPEGENDRSELDILGEMLEGLIGIACCFFFGIIIRWMEVCVVADDVEGDGDMEEIRVRLLWKRISSNCSCAISGGGGGGKVSSSLGSEVWLLWCRLIWFWRIVVEPLLFINDLCWLEVRDVPRMNEDWLGEDLLLLKWCRSFWKWDIGLTGVGGGRSLIERDIGGDAWTNKLLAIIIDDMGGCWNDDDDDEIKGGGGGSGGKGGGKGDIDLIVFTCDERFLTKRIIRSISRQRIFNNKHI